MLPGGLFHQQARSQPGAGNIAQKLCTEEEVVCCLEPVLAEPVIVSVLLICYNLVCWTTIRRVFHLYSVVMPVV